MSSTNDKKREKLKELLFQLAENKKILSDKRELYEIYSTLEDIYGSQGEKRFRHFYSEIFAILTQIDNDPTLGNMDILSENIDIIRKNYKMQNVDVSSSIIKLYDHVNLDVSRLNYSKRVEMRSRDELQRVSAELNNNIDAVASMKESINKVNNIQKEYIAILGIFSAVVLAFVGGMVFSTSVLENIYKSSIYRTVIISLIIGLVFYNIVFIMLEFIRKLNDDSSNKRKWSYWFFNIILIVGIFVTALSYKYDFFDGEQNITETIRKNNVEKKRKDTVEESIIEIVTEPPVENDNVE